MHKSIEQLTTVHEHVALTVTTSGGADALLFFVVLGVMTLLVGAALSLDRRG